MAGGTSMLCAIEPTNAAEPPLRPMNIGSSWRKNHNPIDVNRLPR